MSPVLEILFPSLNERKNYNIFLGFLLPADPATVIEQTKPNLFANASLYSDSSQLAKISHNSFLLLGYALIFWWMCLNIALYSLLGQPRFCLIFILSRNILGFFGCCSSWLSQFIQLHEKDRILAFLNISLGCTSKFFQIH